jgi:tRNA threonylcarbamoyladenosine biosynthesis protein TsaE
MLKTSTTHTFQETQALGETLAKEILQQKSQQHAVVLALQGDLGAGKTTFLQGFAKGLCVAEKITSPTFVLMKRFPLSAGQFKNFYHIDCYRIEEAKHLDDLGLQEILQNPENIVAIEWPERLGEFLKPAITISFEYNQENQRILTFSN